MFISSMGRVNQTSSFHLFFLQLFLLLILQTVNQLSNRHPVSYGVKDILIFCNVIKLSHFLFTFVLAVSPRRITSSMDLNTDTKTPLKCHTKLDIKSTLKLHCIRVLLSDAIPV